MPRDRETETFRTHPPPCRPLTNGTGTESACTSSAPQHECVKSDESTAGAPREILRFLPPPTSGRRRSTPSRPLAACGENRWCSALPTMGRYGMIAASAVNSEKRSPEHSGVDLNADRVVYYSYKYPSQIVLYRTKVFLLHSNPRKVHEDNPSARTSGGHAAASFAETCESHKCFFPNELIIGRFFSRVSKQQVGAGDS